MEKILIVYFSATGNTEKMANIINDSISKEADVTLSDVNTNPSIEGYDRYFLGCPSMGDEVLEETAFEPWLDSIEDKLSNKKVALFGSYGWGDGRWMREWQERSQMKGLNLYDEVLIVNYEPSDEDVIRISEFAKGFLNF